MEPEETVAVVTGGARGIGHACAQALAEDGARVAVLDLDGPEAERVAAALPGDGAGFACDVAVASDVARAFAQVRERFGRVDVLVNNAGTGDASPTEQVSEATWDRVIDVDLKGTLLCSQQAARMMIEQRAGVIVNVASMMGLTSFPNRAAYCSAKAGVIALTEVTAGEWAPHGIRVNAVAPGYVRTAAVEHAIAAGIHEPERIEQWTPLARMARPEEVAGAVRYLVSSAAAFVTGHTLVIDGGFSTYGAWWPPAEQRA
jgi:NAD(P)-dependent dehydrogenase (short-subunit alcohol dehydrogenase family)